MTLCYYCVAIINAGGSISYTYTLTIGGVQNRVATTLADLDGLLGTIGDILSGVLNVVAGSLVMRNTVSNERVFVKAETTMDGVTCCRYHARLVVDN